MSSNREKILPLSHVTDKIDIDTIKSSMSTDRNRGINILMEANHYWDNMESFRRDRERNKRYTYGDQWGDRIKVGCEEITEEKYILNQGSVPLKQNLIRRLVRNVLGVYRSQTKEPTCTARDRDEQKLGETMSTVLQYNMQLNRCTELNARSMEEFLISGLIVQKETFGWRNDKLDCWTDYVQPNNFFIDNNMRDFRGWDVSCLGEIHDVSFDTICAQFAQSPNDYDILKKIYSVSSDKRYIHDVFNQFGYSNVQNYNFFYPTDSSMCRVIEVWKKETKARYRCRDYNNGDVYKIDIEDYKEMVQDINADRRKRCLEAGMPPEDVPLIKAEWFIDDYWYYYYISPLGDILDEGETPYAHKGNPYTFKAYPYIDGEIHSFVADVIDQQRYTNRLITLYDWIMRSSAKGALLFPEDCKPDDMSMEEIADEWARFDGIIAYKPKPGVPMPTQIHSNSVNIGIGDLLNLQLKFFEDISGVNGALQGKPGYASTSGSLYMQQTQNATTSLLDILDTFSMFGIDVAYKKVKNMQQFYDTKRIVNIAGRSGAQIVYDPKKIRDVEFDLSIIESQSTPAYRQMANEMLMEMWRAQQISIEQLLSYGDFPFADDLLQNIQSQKEQLNNGETPEGLSPQLQQKIQQYNQQQGINQNNVGKAQEMLQNVS